MDAIVKKLLKRNGVILVFALIAAISIYRAAQIVEESRREVNNIARINAELGAPVRTVQLKISSDFIKHPLSLRRGRAFVPQNVRDNLKVGMKVGNQKITSVSKNIDFNTGQFEVRVSGNLSGEFYAEEPMRGIFIPREAQSGGFVWIKDNGRAVRRKIKIAAQDADKILASSGIKEGELIIVSSTAALKDGDKVR
ncbi:MAG: hypothetical protein FWD33_03795 [Alphaproteobacteria bacterium]|nr:hypothetical protein [Alphaproteobacteria bacterium]